MGMPSYQSFSTTGAQASVALDWTVVPFNVGYLIVVPGGVTATVAVEYTYDDVNNSAITPVWVSPSGYTSVSATKEGAISSPVRAVRLNVASVSGGSVRFCVLQGLPQ